MNEPIAWNTGLRANLVLWPEVAPNIAAIARCDGELYDQDALRSKYFQEDDTGPNTNRAVRDATAITSLAGLLYRQPTPQDRLFLTDLGASVFSFLGVLGERHFSNKNNLGLLVEPMARGLSVIREYQVIWRLMRATDNSLSNNELNRAMKRITQLDDIAPTAAAILEARVTGQLSSIGDPLYLPPEEADERKAMNPWFRVAGAGGVLIDIDGADGSRHLRPEAAEVIDALLLASPPLFDSSSDMKVATAIARRAAVARPTEMYK